MIAFDIETIPSQMALESRQWKEYRDKKTMGNQDAALHPAFCQVVAICAVSNVTGLEFSHCGPNETTLLGSFMDFCAQESTLAGHNILGFDIPVLFNRMIANRIKVPALFNLIGRKPWEVSHVDTVQMLKNGQGPYLSLDSICFMLGVQSPKEGSVNALGVWDAFNRGDYAQIKDYCMADVMQWIECYKIIKGML